MASGYPYFRPPPVKRKVFVSYHHGNDQRYYDEFCKAFCGTYDVITDRSLDRARDSSDPEYIMRYIREKHLTGSSTMIVLCGLQTRYRKFVDWEISAALRQQMSLIGVKLPALQVIGDGCDKPDRLQDNITTRYAVWTWWEDITANVAALTAAIEEANAKPKILIDNSRPRRQRNG